MTLHVGYEPASKCSDGPTPGARALMSWFLGAYGPRGGRNGGIYLCRTIPGSGALSLHAEGRAGDLMNPDGATWSQPLADALVAHSGELGIQCVIHRGKIWSGSYPYDGWRPYRGASNHFDHNHVELSIAAAAHLTVARLNEVLAAPPRPRTWTDKMIMELPTIRRGSTGLHVRKVQGLLNSYPAADIKIDGSFGPTTETRVRDFQRAMRLSPDGIVGRQTWTALLTR